MNNGLNEMLCSLNREELRQFKYFLKKNANTDKYKDIKLIDSIRKEDAEDVVITNTEKQIRKRLKQSLKQFALLENLKYDNTSEIHSLVEMSKCLFRKKLDKLAWNYLIKAENAAVIAEEYELLDYIYYIQISYSSTIYMPDVSPPDIKELLDKRDKNSSLAKTDGDANAAYALLTSEIRKQFSSRLVVDMDELVNAILQRYNLNDKIYDSPRIYCRIVNIVCKALGDTNDFHKLKEYSMNSYETMKKKKILEKAPADFVLEILSSIYVSTLRIKDYKNCEAFILVYEEYMKKIKVHDDKYITNVFSANINAADLYMSTNRLGLARERLMFLYKNYGDEKISARAYFSLRINLLALFFKDGKYGECVKFFNDLMQQNQTKFLQVVGLETLFYTEIYGVVIYYEKGDAPYAAYLLNKVRKKYADIYSGKDFRRENLFLVMLEKIIDDADTYLKSAAFKSDYNKFVKMKEYIPGYKEYISMNAWLTTKVTGEPYYKCFLELVK